MDKGSLIMAFFEKASKDATISIAHIGLYVTLVQCHIASGFQEPLIAFASEIMPVAKISSSATYHKLIRDLAAYGYIGYEPSFYKGIGSSIYLRMKITMEV